MLTCLNRLNLQKYFLDMNSILANIESNEDDKTAEVRNMLNHYDTVNKILILVEGDDDVIFYSNYLDTEKVFLYQLKGCRYFAKVLGNLNPRYVNRLAAIKDADFDHLNGISPSIQNLFLTDTHDFEMLMISPHSVTDLASQYGLKNELAHHANHIYTDVVHNLSNLSYIKWHNSMRDENEKGICFNKSKAIHHYGKSIRESLEILQPFQDDDVIMDEDAIEALKSNNPDAEISQLINGHDFCELIPKAIKDVRMTNIRNNDIPVKLLALYPSAAFSSTNLALSLERLYPGIVLR